MSATEYTKSALFNALLLGAFAVGTALILGLTYTGTKDLIAESQRIAEEKALIEVIGARPFDNSLLDDIIALNADQSERLNLSSGNIIRVVRFQSVIQGFIFPAIAPDGYSGAIGMLIGIDTEGTLLGVRVVDHRETPGLGDKIDLKKSDWILGFQGKSLQSPTADNWAVTKDGGDFDAFTGATITPRAVVKIVKTALQLSQSDMSLLIEMAQQEMPGAALIEEAQ